MIQLRENGAVKPAGWLAIAFVAVLLTPCAAAAQNWTFDARRIALGGAISGGNEASQLVESETPPPAGERQGYRAIVIPIGLFQVLRHPNVFNPGSTEFDIVRSIEYAASPLHYVFGRDSTGTGGAFVTDVRNGRLSRDLNAYRGFVPVTQPVSEGLSNPSFGGTIRFARDAGGGYQGIYVGAGPYLAMRNVVAIDPQLTAILGSDTPVYVPNTRLTMASGLRGEGAVAITGGYRVVARQPDAGPAVYVAANYHYLRGLRYEDGTFGLAVETDRNGLLTLGPSLLSPLGVVRDTSTSGNGFAIDLGVAVVANQWEFGVSANGIANRITWTGVERRSYALPNLFAGSGTFITSAPQPIADARVELPVDYRGNVGYRAGRWSVVAEAGHGFQGGLLRGGAEYRVSGVAFRGGGLYSREQWQPTGGVGLPLARRVALDLALFGTSANIERRRHAALAVSLRIG